MTGIWPPHLEGDGVCEELEKVGSCEDKSVGTPGSYVANAVECQLWYDNLSAFADGLQVAGIIRTGQRVALKVVDA